MKIGDSLPNFSLLNEEGENVNSHSWIGQPLVVYFYPKDDTPGCTAEACSFRDQFAEFDEMGTKVVGISSDSVESHKNFKLKHRLPYTLLADTAGAVKKKFGVKGNLFGLIPGRVTYIFNKEGRLLHEFSSQLNVTKHVAESIAILKKNQ